MTVKRDLKRRVRERQEKTGERYTTALSHVLKQARGDMSERSIEIEMEEVTERAEAAGLRCRAFLSPELSRWKDQKLLERLRDVLIATEGDPGTERFRRVLLRGEREEELADRMLKHFAGTTLVKQWAAARSFATNLRAGIRGPSRDGLMIAYDLPLPGRAPLTVVAVLIPPFKGARSTLLLSDSTTWLERDSYIL